MEAAVEAAVMAVGAARAVVMVAGRAGWAVILPPGRVAPVFAPTVGTGKRTWQANRVTRNNVRNAAPR